MKIFLHYVIWNKETMTEWLFKGIDYFLPTGSHIDIVLDNCIDQTEYFVKECFAGRSNHFTRENFTYEYFKSTKSFRFQNTNDAIERFMKSDCDIFLSPQDDQKIQDDNLTDNLERLYDKPNCGIVGMRDGITKGQFWSAQHSQRGRNTIWLSSGESTPVNYVNDGPICLNKKVISQVGLFDVENFIAFNIDLDYSIRCRQAGFQNYVMGAEIVHEKWGNVIASTLYTQEISAHDEDAYNLKHPNRD